MSSSSDEPLALAREDEDFVKRVAASYAPPPMAAARRAAFDEALWGRIRRSYPARHWFAAVWLPAAALAAVWFFFLSPGTEPLGPPEATVPALSARAWAEELFLDGDSFESEQPDESELLPDEYLAIASIFLDG